ncbi:energy transducer TonB, partial [Rhodovulum imhoffii]
RGGERGESVLSLAAVTPGLRQLAESWETAPPVRADPPAMRVPAVADVAPMPQTGSARPKTAEPVVLAPGQPDTTPQIAPPLRAKPAPVRPQAGQVARGTGGAPRAALATPAPQAGLSPGQEKSLRVDWGRAILTRVSRSHRYPQGAVRDRMQGRALVELVVARDGRLVSVRLVQSTGAAVLDKAALAAVRGAGRFPPAPKGLTQGRYSFTIPLRFAPPRQAGGSAARP